MSLGKQYMFVTQIWIFVSIEEADEPMKLLFYVNLESQRYKYDNDKYTI